jgi:hypothetical protein
MRIIFGFTALTALVSLIIPSSVSGQRLIGPLLVSDVEAAFGLEAGSVFIEGDAEFTTIKDVNYWTVFDGFPLYLSRFIESEFSTPRSEEASFLAAAGRPMLQITPDSWFERFVTGCFYLPREQEVVDFFDANMLEDCNTVAGSARTWNIVGFVDEETILVSFLATASETQYMTQLSLFTSASFEGAELLAITVTGPSVGVYANFSTPDPDLFDTDLLATNSGQFFLAFQHAVLEEDCPAEVCGNYLAPPIVASAIPNPLAPAWPETVTENQCDWWPTSNVCIVTNTPPEFPSCIVCGGNKFVGVPDVTVTNPLDNAVVTCAQAESAGLDGLIAPQYCLLLPAALANVCECTGPADSGGETSDPPTPPNMAPTMAPTTKALTRGGASGAVVRGRSLVAFAASGLVAAALTLW